MQSKHVLKSLLPVPVPVTRLFDLPSLVNLHYGELTSPPCPFSARVLVVVQWTNITDTQRLFSSFINWTSLFTQHHISTLLSHTYTSPPSIR
jgi:hypothetical protein